MSLSDSERVGHDFVAKRTRRLAEIVSEDGRLSESTAKILSRIEICDTEYPIQKRYRLSSDAPDLSEEVNVVFGVKAGDNPKSTKYLCYDIHQRKGISAKHGTPVHSDDDVTGRISSREIAALLETNADEYLEMFSNSRREDPWTPDDFDSDSRTGLKWLTLPDTLPLYDASRHESEKDDLRARFIDEVADRRRCFTNCEHQRRNIERNTEIARQFTHGLQLPQRLALPDVTLDLIIYGAVKQIASGQRNDKIR